MIIFRYSIVGLMINHLTGPVRFAPVFSWFSARSRQLPVTINRNVFNDCDVETLVGSKSVEIVLTVIANRSFETFEYLTIWSKSIRKSILINWSLSARFIRARLCFGCRPIDKHNGIQSSMAPTRSPCQLSRR